LLAISFSLRLTYRFADRLRAAVAIERATLSTLETECSSLRQIVEQRLVDGDRARASLDLALSGQQTLVRAMSRLPVDHWRWPRQATPPIIQLRDLALARLSHHLPSAQQNRSSFHVAAPGGPSAQPASSPTPYQLVADRAALALSMPTGAPSSNRSSTAPSSSAPQTPVMGYGRPSNSNQQSSRGSTSSSGGGGGLLATPSTSASMASTSVPTPGTPHPSRHVTAPTLSSSASGARGTGVALAPRTASSSASGVDLQKLAQQQQSKTTVSGSRTLPQPSSTPSTPLIGSRSPHHATSTSGMVSAGTTPSSSFTGTNISLMSTGIPASQSGGSSVKSAAPLPSPTASLAIQQAQSTSPAATAIALPSTPMPGISRTLSTSDSNASSGHSSASHGPSMQHVIYIISRASPSELADLQAAYYDQVAHTFMSLGGVFSH
jgi:hypothetical protein